MSASAAERRAEVDLGYTRVTAPDNGLIGKTEIQAGTLVGRGMPTLLTRISKIDPIHVRFTLAEKDYLQFARARADKGQGERMASRPLEMLLADGSVRALSESIDISVWLALATRKGGESLTGVNW